MRQRTTSLCAPLSVEDHSLQPMADASPAKWHLAHTTWFFETFVLKALGEAPHDARFPFLFNSYYEGAGPRAERAKRGLVSRPALDEVRAYRAAVDARVSARLEAGTLDAAALDIVELGLHHEQQHQELILTDVKYALATQPFSPAYRDATPAPAQAATALRWTEFAGGVVDLGADTTEFAFDNERPRHKVFVAPFALANRPVSNAEVIAFIESGGYRDANHWLSDGFAHAQHEHWTAPLYWEQRDGQWWSYQLEGGMQPVVLAAPAAHLSLYEADAIARFLGGRLPTEHEWELASAGADPTRGNFADDDLLAPSAAIADVLAQQFGDVWEWTASAYSAYPGFRPLGGTLGEYNGKFMSGQMVLRGGSCFTPRGHVRASYRNFFPPSARWQMTGVRLATDRGLP